MMENGKMQDIATVHSRELASYGGYDGIERVLDRLDDLKKLATVYWGSKFLPSHLDNLEKIQVVMMSLLELGLQPSIQMMSRLYVINGKAEVDGFTMNLLIRNAGGKIESIEKSNTRCELRGIRPDGSEETAEFTIEDAERAGLTTGKNAHSYKKYPADMLYWKCLSRLARQHFPEMISGVYLLGETGHGKVEISPNGEMIVVESEIDDVTVDDVEDLSTHLASKYTASYGSKPLAIGATVTLDGIEYVYTSRGVWEDAQETLNKLYVEENNGELPRPNESKMQYVNFNWDYTGSGWIQRMPVAHSQEDDVFGETPETQTIFEDEAPAKKKKAGTQQPLFPMQ